MQTIGAAGTGLFLVFFFGPTIISALRLKQGKGQPIRVDGPQSHLLTKKGTPTMGGLMILCGLLAASLLWANLASPYVWKFTTLAASTSPPTVTAVAPANNAVAIPINQSVAATFSEPVGFGVRIGHDRRDTEDGVRAVECRRRLEPESRPRRRLL